MLLWHLRHMVARTTDWSWYPLRVFKHGRRCKVPLERYITRYAPRMNGNGGTLCLTLLHGEGYRYFIVNTMLRRLSELYSDAEYGFALENCTPLRSKVPVALVTFKLVEHTNGTWATVEQLQGVKGRQPNLNGIRWERMLLHIVTDWARERGCVAVTCIRGKDSGWAYKVKDDRLYLRYDVSARRNGFRYDEAHKVWRLNLVDTADA